MRRRTQTVRIEGMRHHQPRVIERGAATRWRTDQATRLGVCLSLSIVGFVGTCVAPHLAFAAKPRAAAAASAPATVAESLAAQAMIHFKAGDHPRAIELYLAAWEQDPRDLTPLFNAARVAHTARLFERADGLYQRYLEQPDVPASGRAAAERYRDEIRQARADLAADEASRLAAKGHHAAAATAWRAAYQYAPERPHMLLAAARASRAAGVLDLAERDYEAFIARSPPGPVRSDALAELEALRIARHPAIPAEQPNVAPTRTSVAPAVVASSASAGRPTWAWIGCGVGVAAAAAGVGGWLWAHDQATKLQAAVAPGAPPTWTHAAAAARARTLGTNLTVSVAAMATGAAVAAAAGAILLWPAPRSKAATGADESVSLALSWTGRGVALTRTF